MMYFRREHVPKELLQFFEPADCGQCHVCKMVEVFRQVKRVLRQDGVCFINYGDCYAGSPNGRSAADVSALGNDDRTFRDKPFGTAVGGLKPKDLVMMPARVALALQAEGWWLRSDIIWAKPNPMPESCRDRPTSAHEHLFLLTRSPKYYYDQEAVREGRTQDEDAATFRGGSYVGGEPGPRAVTGNKRIKMPDGWDTGPGAHGNHHREGREKGRTVDKLLSGGRNLRNVWTIATAPFSEAHFATFPPALVEPCIKAGTSERGACAKCGAPWVRKTIAEQVQLQATNSRDKQSEVTGWDRSKWPRTTKMTTTTGWSPSCACDAAVVPCVVLDVFAGAFTVPLVAERLRRDSIGIELNPEYVRMGEKRLRDDASLLVLIQQDAPLPFPADARADGQLALEAPD